MEHSRASAAEGLLEKWSESRHRPRGEHVHYCIIHSSRQLGDREVSSARGTLNK